MTRAASVLLGLLKSSLGYGYSGEEMRSLSCADWNRVVDLAFDNGVAALAVDGLQKLYESNPELELEIDSEALEDLKYEWFGEVMQAENDYREHCQKVKKICRTYADNGFKPILLKGIGLSLDYPIPEHRLCGDLDIFLTEGKNLEGDMMIKEKLGLEVTKKKAGHHSHFTYKGLLVENHYELSSSYSGGREGKVARAGITDADCYWPF